MRATPVDPADMSPAQRALYRRFTTGPRADPDSPFRLVAPDGRLQGPPALWVLSPVFGEALERLGGTVRFDSQLPARAREIAILLVAHHHRSAFELHAHERAGAAAGLTAGDLAALASGTRPPDLSIVEAVVFDATRQLLDTGTLDDPGYRRAVGLLGESGLFELVAIVGYYAMLALQLAVFDIRPEGTP